MSFPFRVGRVTSSLLHRVSQVPRLICPRAPSPLTPEGTTAAFTRCFTDSILHDKLQACLRMRIADRTVLKLIRMWLETPMVEVSEAKGGAPKVSCPQKGNAAGRSGGEPVHIWDLTLTGEPDEGNPHVRFDEGRGRRASASLLSYATVESLYRPQRTRSHGL